MAQKHLIITKDGNQYSIDDLLFGKYSKDELQKDDFGLTESEKDTIRELLSAKKIDSIIKQTVDNRFVSLPVEACQKFNNYEKFCCDLTEDDIFIHMYQLIDALQNYNEILASYESYEVYLYYLYSFAKYSAMNENKYSGFIDNKFSIDFENICGIVLYHSSNCFNYNDGMRNWLVHIFDFDDRIKIADTIQEAKKCKYIKISNELRANLLNYNANYLVNKISEFRSMDREITIKVLKYLYKRLINDFSLKFELSEIGIFDYSIMNAYDLMMYGSDEYLFTLVFMAGVDDNR